MELLDNNLNQISWVDNDKIKKGDVIFLENLGINVIINKLGMSYIWADVRHSNISLKIKR